MDDNRAQPQERRELEDHLINRALRDDEFRELLIREPRRALEAELRRLGLGIVLPPGLKIEVLEETADTLYLILPPSLIAGPPPEDDFFERAMRALNVDPSSNEPS